MRASGTEHSAAFRVRKQGRRTRRILFRLILGKTSGDAAKKMPRRRLSINLFFLYALIME